MHDARQAVRLPMLFQQLERIVPGFTRMDHDGLARFGRNRHLFDEHRLLHIARRMIVVIIQSDFAQRQHLRMRQQLGQLLCSFRRRLRRVVRMHAHGRIDGCVAIRQARRYLDVRRTIARSDCQHALDSGRECAIDDGIAIGVEIGVVQVAM